MKSLFIVILCFIIPFNTISACDCAGEGSFITVAHQTPFIALVKIKSYVTFKDIYGDKVPMSMQVDIISIYKGKEDRKTVTVWGDNGAMCRPYLSTFNEGAYYVIAFYKGKVNVGHKDEKTTDYAISSCGTYWLSVGNTLSFAYGNVDGKVSSIKLTSLKSKLSKGIH